MVTVAGDAETDTDTDTRPFYGDLGVYEGRDCLKVRVWPYTIVGRRGLCR